MKKPALCKLSQIAVQYSRTTIPKFQRERMLFNLAQDLSKSWPLVHYTLKWVKHVFWSLRQGNVFFHPKDKNFKKTQIVLGFPLTRSKTVLPIWGAKKNNKLLFSTFSFLQILFEVKGRNGQIFEEQKFISIRSLWFFENENFATHAPLARLVKLADFSEFNP